MAGANDGRPVAYVTATLGGTLVRRTVRAYPRPPHPVALRGAPARRTPDHCHCSCWGRGGVAYRTADVLVRRIPVRRTPFRGRG